jgi:hypothetical protein
MPMRNPYIFPDQSWIKDWRAYENASVVVGTGTSGGTELRRFGYLEGLSSRELPNGVRVQAVTIAERHEGDNTQHIITRRSQDNGKTWTKWKAIEPETPPISQYGKFITHPETGRTYYIYGLGPKGFTPLLPDGRKYRGGPLHTIYRMACRRVHADGTIDDARHILPIPLTAIDRENVFKGAHTCYSGRARPDLVVGDDGIGWCVKLGPTSRIDVNGEAFIVVFEDWAKNDHLEDLKIRLLPEGDHGIRNPGDPCLSGFRPVHVDKEDIYFTYRNRSGYVGLAESHDGGRTFTAGPMRYALDDTPVKHPMGPVKACTDDRGRMWLSFYNCGFRDEGRHRKGIGFDGRDLIYLAPIRIEEDRLRLGQPELAVYRRDGRGWKEDLRMNYLTIEAEDDDAYRGRTSNKRTEVTMRIPRKFIDFVAGQFAYRGIPEQGVLVHAADPADDFNAPTWDLRAVKSATWMFSVAGGLPAGTILLKSTDAAGAGIKMTVGPEHNVLVAFGDGRHKAQLPGDVDGLDPTAGRHHIAVILDGHARLASMVIDGRLQDGGKRNLRGVIRYGGAIRSVLAGAATWQVHDGVADLRIYNRSLLITEVIGACRASESRQ